VQFPYQTAVVGGEHPARSAPSIDSVRLDGEYQLFVAVVVHLHDMQVSNVEDCIDSGAPGRA
jgi:hypothetical protein